MKKIKNNYVQLAENNQRLLSEEMTLKLQNGQGTKRIKIHWKKK